MTQQAAAARWGAARLTIAWMKGHTVSRGRYLAQNLASQVPHIQRTISGHCRAIDFSEWGEDMIDTSLKARSHSQAFGSSRGRTQTPRISPRLAALVMAVSVLASSSRGVRSQTSPSPNPTCYAQLSRAKLISGGTGWAIAGQAPEHSAAAEGCTNERLYWTDNDGQTWRDITPLHMPARSIGTLFYWNQSLSSGTVFFLDRSHGWVISTDSVDGGKDARFYLVITQNNGRAWQSVLLPRPSVNWITEMNPIDMFFSDPNHGWILWRWSMMNSRANALTATSDGGRTWRTLPEPPGPGPLEFTSSLKGWMVGASAGQEGIPITEDDQLWTTHDGGKHWRAISVPVPADSPENVRFGELKFDKKGDGVLVAQTQVSGYVETFFTCVTHNGGRLWQFSKFDEYGARPSLVGTHIIWTVFYWPMTPPTIRIGDREIAPVIPEALSLQGRLGNVDFIDDSNAWATYANGRTAPLTSQPPLELLSTSDGGKTFRVITPPFAENGPIPPPELYTVNGSIVRWPPMPPIARRPPPIAPNGGQQLRFAPPAGGPMMMTGTGFRQENTVWIGSHEIQVASKDGENLQFLVPLDITPGTYKTYVENVYGKTNEAEISIRRPQSLRISNIQNGERIHPGRQIFLTGSGFLLENTVWFGTQGVAAKLVLSGGAILQVDVPTSIPPGLCEIHVTNAAGKSDVVSVTVE